MNVLHKALFFSILIGLSSCETEQKEKTATESAEQVSTDLQLDHFNIWVTNPTKAKERLMDLGFTAVPDSLCDIHEGQGTTGRYFNFLNSYLELIFVYDQEELEENNHQNKDLDFTVRANFEKNGASPFSLALKVKDYDISKIPFEKVRYHQDWMREDANIYTAKNSKINPREPSVFVVSPDIESDQFETLSDLNKIPEEYAKFRQLYKHPNGAQKVTQIVITSKGVDTSTKTMKAANGIEQISIQNGTEHLMEIYFDDAIQKKTFDLRPELPLIIHL